MSNKTPEDEARSYAYKHMRLGHIENDLRDAHLAGQSVGYSRALEDLLAEAYCEGQTISERSDSQWVMIDDLEKAIGKLKAKGGA